jgi:hypothetical protein
MQEVLLPHHPGAWKLHETRKDERSVWNRVSNTLTDVAPNGSYVYDIVVPYNRVDGRRKAVFEQPECHRDHNNIPDPDLAREGIRTSAAAMNPVMLYEGKTVEENVGQLMYAFAKIERLPSWYQLSSLRTSR